MWRSASVIVALMIGVGACGSDAATTLPATVESEPVTSAPDTASTASTTGSTVPVVAPTTVAPLPTESSPQPTIGVAAALTGWNWESSRIDRACGDVWSEREQANQRLCTEVVIDPQGIPVSYDPFTRRVTRERREGTEPVAFTLPDEYVDASLLAAGPHDLVYFALDNDSLSSPDVIALALAPGDTGRLVERSDVPSPIPFGAFDDANNVVQAHNWQWSIEDRRVVAEQPGTSAVMPTFDGGFLATYSETTGAMRTEVIRGWRDGAVEYLEFPMSLTALDGPLVLEPQGTLLVPNGESFARLAPFQDRPTGWEAQLQIDVEAGTAAPVGLDEYLDTIVWPASGQSHVWPWGTSLVAFANAVAGGSPSSPSELRTIQEGSVQGTTAVVTVTTEGFLDDSVHGTRLVMHISLDQPGFRIVRIDWSNACQPDRGHQDYQAEHCT